MGNVRTMVAADQFTDPQQYVATHELMAANVEGLVFTHIDNVRFDRPEGLPGNLNAARLNGSEHDRIIGSSLAVKVMAGDKMKVNSYHYYEPNGDPNAQVTAEDMAAAIIESLNAAVKNLGAGEGSNELFTNMFNENNYINIYNDLKEDWTNAALPRAYLNFLVFDENMVLVPDQSHSWQVSAVEESWEPLGMDSELEIGQNGYAVVYLSNEQYMDVYFDDLQITHYRGRLLEEMHYYPHGLLIKKDMASGYAPENKFQYEGKKMQDELGLQLYDFHARQYDPQIGRFWGVDPADQFPSGYTGKGNDPANLVDPSGMTANGFGSGYGGGVSDSKGVNWDYYASESAGWGRKKYTYIDNELYYVEEYNGAGGSGAPGGGEGGGSDGGGDANKGDSGGDGDGKDAPKNSTQKFTPEEKEQHKGGNTEVKQQESDLDATLTKLGIVVGAGGITRDILEAIRRSPALVSYLSSMTMESRVSVLKDLSTLTPFMKTGARSFIIVGAGISIVQGVNNLYRQEYGKATKSALDLGMVGVGLIPIIGTSISVLYFTGDAAGGWDQVIEVGERNRRENLRIIGPSYNYKD